MASVSNYIANTCGINQLQEVIVENIALNSMEKEGNEREKLKVLCTIKNSSISK